MTNLEREEAIASALVRGSTSYRDDQMRAWCRALEAEANPRARWVLEQIVENAETAEQRSLRLCDDTGVPHLILEIGRNEPLDAGLLDAIQRGVAQGMRRLPGRPMAVVGDDIQRLEQSQGLAEDPAALVPAPISMRTMEEAGVRLHILMQGGGPEIRGKTYRVFHQHKLSVLLDEITAWAQEASALLGCTPCTPAIGIGRSHFEATSLMLDAMAHGNFDVQSDLEREITDRINAATVGPLGLGGNTTALATFLKIGPQRASGVRIVCLRLCCCVEPRVASVLL